MEQYVGLDVSVELTLFCVVDGAGVELARGREVTRPDLLVAALGRHAPRACGGAGDGRSVDLVAAGTFGGRGAGGDCGCAPGQGGAVVPFE